MAKFITTTLMDSYAGGPHITETQIGLANQATFGPDDYVLGGGRESEAQVLTNNSIRIFDAVYCIQGRRDVIPASGYTDVTIANGTQGMNRNDIIVRRYRKDESSEIESTEYAVIKGTPNAGEALDPEVTIGDIRTGATLHEMKLYRVKIEGLNITAVEPLFNILKNMAVLQQEIVQTNKDLADRLDKDYILAYGTWYANGTVIPLNDSYLNYRDIIIRTGWNNQNGGIRDHRLSIQKNGTTIYEIVPIYQATKYIGVLVVEFNPNTPNQIKIVQSTGITSASATIGIRNIMGRTKLS